MPETNEEIIKRMNEGNVGLEEVVSFISSRTNVIKSPIEEVTSGTNFIPEENRDLVEKLELYENILRTAPNMSSSLFASEIDFNNSKEDMLDLLAIKAARLEITNPKIPTQEIQNAFGVINRARNESRTSYKFGMGTPEYKTIMEYSSDYIALKIRNAKQKGSLDVEKVNFDEIIRNSPPQLAEKILQVAEEVNKQENDGEIISSIRSNFIKFKKFCAGISSENLEDEKLVSTFVSFIDFSKAQSRETSTLDKSKKADIGNKIRSVIEKAKTNLENSNTRNSNQTPRQPNNTGYQR